LSESTEQTELFTVQQLIGIECLPCGEMMGPRLSRIDKDDEEATVLYKCPKCGNVVEMGIHFRLKCPNADKMSRIHFICKQCDTPLECLGITYLSIYEMEMRLMYICRLCESSTKSEHPYVVHVKMGEVMDE